MQYKYRWLYALSCFGVILLIAIMYDLNDQYRQWLMVTNQTINLRMLSQKLNQQLQLHEIELSKMGVPRLVKSPQHVLQQVNTLLHLNGLQSQPMQYLSGSHATNAVRLTLQGPAQQMTHFLMNISQPLYAGNFSYKLFAPDQVTLQVDLQLLNQIYRQQAHLQTPITPAHPVTQPFCANQDSIYAHKITILPDEITTAIQILAKALHHEVILSPNIHGTVMVDVAHVPPTKALPLLLAANGLTKWQVGNMWFIGPQEELMKRKQDELKWQEMLIDTASLQQHTWPLRYAQAAEVAKLLSHTPGVFLSKRGHVSVDTRTNMLFVQDSAIQLAKMAQVIKRLDVPVKQVHIAARLVSVDNNFAQELGINYQVKAVNGDTDLSSGTLRSKELGQYSVAVATLADGSLLDVKLAALEHAGHAEIISSPSLFAANQQAASIEAGEEVPYQEVSESGGTAIVFKKAVLGLKVTPQILPDNKVLLQLQINQDRPSNKSVLGMPAISTRQMMTSVLVKSGATIVLGGIYETNKENAEQGLPFLSRLPVLGILFKQREVRESKRELLIFVTPNIITQAS